MIQPCPICFENVECILLECNHSFCQECLTGSILHFDVSNDNFNCAMCRQTVQSFENEELNSHLKDLQLRIEFRKLMMKKITYMKI